MQVPRTADEERAREELFRTFAELRRADRERRKAERLAAKRLRAEQVRPEPAPDRAVASQVRAVLRMGTCPAGCGTWTLQLDAGPTDRTQLGAFADWLDEETGAVSLKSHLLRAIARYPIDPPATG